MSRLAAAAVHLQWATHLACGRWLKVMECASNVWCVVFAIVVRADVDIFGGKAAK